MKGFISVALLFLTLVLTAISTPQDSETSMIKNGFESSEYLKAALNTRVVVPTSSWAYFYQYGIICPSPLSGYSCLHGSEHCNSAGYFLHQRSAYSACGGAATTSVNGSAVQGSSACSSPYIGNPALAGTNTRYTRITYVLPATSTYNLTMVSVLGPFSARATVITRSWTTFPFGLSINNDAELLPPNRGHLSLPLPFSRGQEDYVTLCSHYPS